MYKLPKLDSRFSLGSADGEVIDHLVIPQPAGSTLPSLYVGISIHPMDGALDLDGVAIVLADGDREVARDKVTISGEGPSLWIVNLHAPYAKKFYLFRFEAKGGIKEGKLPLKRA